MPNSQFIKSKRVAPRILFPHFTELPNPQAIKFQDSQFTIEPVTKVTFSFQITQGHLEWQDIMGSHMIIRLG